MKNYPKFNPKEGDLVRVCYDGKSGRAVVGKILKRRGFAIQVEFKDWVEQEPSTNWFIRISQWAFGGHLRSKHSLMNKLFGKSCPGDWYSVYAEDK